MAQHVFVLWFADDGSTNLSALNTMLSQGYRVIHATPMSGTGEQGNETPQSPFPYSRAAIVLQQVAGPIQRAFVLWFGDDGSTNLAALNGMLTGSTSVETIVAMSGTGEHGSETPQSPFAYSRALVIMQG
jgi:hypothetical protein